MPLISVIMPAFNASKYLPEAIESILKQSFTDFEFIICDDGSTDNTLSIIKKYAGEDNRIRVLENKKNIGNLKTTNRLLAECKGEYVTVQDADDFSDTNRLELLLLEFKKDPNVGIVGSYYFFVNDKNEVYQCGLLPINNNVIKDEMEKKIPPLLYASVMVKKEIIDKTGNFRLFFNRIGSADFDWMARIIEKSDVANIPHPLYFYRKHESQFTASYNPHENIYCKHMHALIVEAHKRRENGLKDFFEAPDKMPMRKFIGELYIKESERFFWDSRFGKSFKSLGYSFLIFPFNSKVYKTTFFIFKKWLLK